MCVCVSQDGSHSTCQRVSLCIGSSTTSSAQGNRCVCVCGGGVGVQSHTPLFALPRPVNSWPFNIYPSYVSIHICVYFTLSVPICASICSSISSLPPSSRSPVQPGREQVVMSSTAHQHPMCRLRKRRSRRQQVCECVRTLAHTRTRLALSTTCMVLPVRTVLQT